MTESSTLPATHVATRYVGDDSLRIRRDPVAVPRPGEGPTSRVPPAGAPAIVRDRDPLVEAIRARRRFLAASGAATF
jgi:hypothetical protein